MTSLNQGNRTEQDYYQSVYQHFSLIINKIGCMDFVQESAALLTITYRDKALDTFIRGLRGDWPRLLTIKELADLSQALHLCLKLENQNLRTHYVKSAPLRRPPPSPLPPRNTQSNNFRPTTFCPQLAYQPQQYQSITQQPTLNILKTNKDQVFIIQQDQPTIL